jgi:hypothetical protein
MFTFNGFKIYSVNGHVVAKQPGLTLEFKDLDSALSALTSESTEISE